MLDLLTTTEAAHAAEQGWQLCHVHIPETGRWIVSPLPTGASPLKHVPAAQSAVVGAARAGDKVAIRALQLVMQSHQKPAKRKPKK